MDKHDEQPKQEKKRSVTPAIVFFILLAALTVVAFILPLRPTRSYSEKRELTPFPEFSAAALLSGDYFDGTSAWFSDTFPGRESWLRASGAVEQLHGVSDVTIYGELYWDGDCSYHNDVCGVDPLVIPFS